MFLDGKQDRILRAMRKEMQAASDQLEFERAAVFRDRIKKLESVLYGSLRLDKFEILHGPLVAPENPFGADEFRDHHIRALFLTKPPEN